MRFGARCKRVSHVRDGHKYSMQRAGATTAPSGCYLVVSINKDDNYGFNCLRVRDYSKEKNSRLGLVQIEEKNSSRCGILLFIYKRRKERLIRKKKRERSKCFVDGQGRVIIVEIKNLRRCIFKDYER